MQLILWRINTIFLYIWLLQLQSTRKYINQSLTNLLLLWPPLWINLQVFVAWNCQDWENCNGFIRFSVQRSDFVALHVSNKTWSLDVSKVSQVSESMRWFKLIVPNLGENWDNLSKYGVMWYSMESKPYYESS